MDDTSGNVVDSEAIKLLNQNADRCKRTADALWKELSKDPSAVDAPAYSKHLIFSHLALLYKACAMQEASIDGLNRAIMALPKGPQFAAIKSQAEEVNRNTNNTLKPLAEGVAEATERSELGGRIYR